MSTSSRLLHAALLAGLMFASSSGPARAETLRVPQDFATIQAAVDAAQAGDEIRIAKGVYAETVAIVGKSDLLLRGTGHVLTGNRALGSGEHGFEVLSGGHLFEDNRALKSGGFDLFDEMEPGANTYVGNVFGSSSFGDDGDT